jgi:hypothetical protein
MRLGSSSIRRWSVADLLVVALRLGFDGERHRRLGKLDPFGRECPPWRRACRPSGESQLRYAADVAGDELRVAVPCLPWRCRAV